MTHARMTLRQATAEDVDAIAKVHVEGWRWGYRGHMPAALLDGLSEERRAAMWRDLLAAPEPAARVWLAERDGRLIGFCATGPAQAPEETGAPGDPPLTAQITAIYLREEAAGTGVGRELLRHATEDLRERGFRAAVLWVLASNARARRFYEIAGWRPDGATRIVRQDGADLPHVRYARELESTIIVVPELRSERLLLRRWRDDDREPFAALNADPRVMEFFPSVLSRAASDAMVERIRGHFVERGFGFWALEVPGVTAFAGFVGLKYPHLPAPFTPAVEVGWRLACDYWGRGYATEGARAALAAGFGRLGLHEIVSMTVPTNVRSRHVMEKLGMRHTPADDFEHPRIAEGHPFRPHVLYRLSRADWANQAAGTGR
jgi:RimJ/RimL family protein N-acetyltransferase